jgi:hypothetical protein
MIAPCALFLIASLAISLSSVSLGFYFQLFKRLIVSTNMLSTNFVFLAQSPSPSQSAVANSVLGTPGTPVGIAKAFDEVWTIAMDGNLYRLVCTIGLMIAIFAVGFWCVKFYLALEEGGYKPVVNEMIFPLILIILLSNGGSNMRNLTVTARDIMNNVNDSVNRVVGVDIDMRKAIEALAINQAAKNSLVSLFESCDPKYNLNEFNTCVRNRKVIADDLVRNVEANTESIGNESFKAQMKIWLVDLQQTVTSYAELTSPQQVGQIFGYGTTGTAEMPTPEIKIDNYPIITPSPAASPAPNANTAKTPDLFAKSTYTSRAAMQEINTTILSFRKAFLYIIEVMLIVTALIGPIFVALSMFPVGTKPMLAWGTSFLSLGFCKICFSLISGLSAIAFVYAGPDKIDMTVVAIVLGLLAPVLSFAIASGSGINALSNVSQISQNFGLNTGAAYYVPGSGQPNGNSNIEANDRTR